MAAAPAVDIYVTRLTTVQGGQPAKINVVQRLTAGAVYNINLGLVDQFTVTGAQGGTLNFSYDNLIINTWTLLQEVDRGPEGEARVQEP